MRSRHRGLLVREDRRAERQALSAAPDTGRTRTSQRTSATRQKDTRDGESLYRRGLYTTGGAPSCTRAAGLRRPEPRGMHASSGTCSNTPQQALVLLNDPTSTSRPPASWPNESSSEGGKDAEAGASASATRRSGAGESLAEPAELKVLAGLCGATLRRSSAGTRTAADLQKLVGDGPAPGEGPRHRRAGGVDVGDGAVLNAREVICQGVSSRRVVKWRSGSNSRVRRASHPDSRLDAGGRGVVTTSTRGGRSACATP